MKLCLLFLVNTVGTFAFSPEPEDHGSVNAEWWMLESKLEKEKRDLEFVELVVIIKEIEIDSSLPKEDLEFITERTESLHIKFSHLTQESSRIAEKIQTLANLLASQSATEMITLSEEEMLLNFIDTVMKTRERIATIQDFYLEQYNEFNKAEEEWLEMELVKDLTLLRSVQGHLLNFSKMDEVVILKKMFRSKVSEVIDACDLYIEASEVWTVYYDVLDKFYESFEKGAQNYAPEPVEQGDEHQKILTETRQFLRAYKEVLATQENATVGIDTSEHTEL